METLSSEISGTTLAGLQSSQSTRRLEQISRLRARGISEHVDLPQLVVSGDQSAGKSSVLEGITGLSFPRKDGVCTRFATEIILQHSASTERITATILPCSSRSEVSKVSLQAYRRQLQSFDTLETVIAEVGTLLGIRGFGNIQEGPAFVEDVLRIELSGPVGLHLTIVDLPGIISVANEEQSEDDVRTVQKLVESYLSNPRTIILAVIQANNDIANQGIIQKSRLVDKTGKRTVGIITKPDLINEGTEKRIAMLAKNQDTTKLKLGFFLLKNPAPLEIEEGLSLKQREKNEMLFFQSSPWREQGLDAKRTGIAALRIFLQTLLEQHIERELPKVRTEIESLAIQTEHELTALGEERPTTGHQRMFLTRLAMQFHGLVTSALNGTYHETDPTFFGGDVKASSCRLRALVHQHNTKFADYMRQSGQKRKVVVKHISAEDSEAGPESENSEGAPQSQDGQILVTESEMKDWVKEVYQNSRGRELPGDYNHVLLSELFHIESSRWHRLAKSHIAVVYDNIYKFINGALCHIVKDEQVLTELVDMTRTALKQKKISAEGELEQLVQDERQQPITYNHYYTDNVQKARQISTRQLIEQAMKDATVEDWIGKSRISNERIDGEKLIASLHSRVMVNMDDQACSEALDSLRAYYKVAQKTFVDNVCRQVIERHLLRALGSLLSPESIAALDDQDLKRIAAESPANAEKRLQLRQLSKGLTESLEDLKSSGSYA